MGACFDYFTCKDKVQDRYEDECDEAQRESGSSYSGRINMTNGLDIRRHKVFACIDDAEEYVSKNAEKWDDAIAVQYRASGKRGTSAKLMSLDKQYHNAKDKLRTLHRSLSDKVEKQLKSTEFITCKGCKSRMDTRFSRHTLKCPICDSSFLKQTDLKKIKTLETKIEEIKKKYQTEAKVLQIKADKKMKGETMWFVGGICSS